ncbi:two-component sensor histidine kinase [Microbacteriaceae bacterium VKM Ac-2855]|nr:two-component sensor histidine kinase [Microbacteriaceae bacterium VKM Ac-2855]
MKRTSWTLRRRLVTGVAVIVGVAVVVVGLLSVVTLHRTLTAMVDTRIQASMSALGSSLAKYSTDPDRFEALGNPISGQNGGQNAGPNLPGARFELRDRAADGFTKPFTEFFGQAPGTIIALVTDGAIVDSSYFDSDQAVPLDAAAGAAVVAVAGGDIDNESIAVPGLGSYRVMTVTTAGGDTLVAGIPLAATEAAVTSTGWAVAGIALLVIALTVLGAMLVIRFALRPLGTVVATAQEVTTLRLDRGDAAITTRVPEEYTDPHTEVGQVGGALNRLLSHVDDALAVRQAADERMRRFVTDASHELRTPLAAIQGYAELTRQGNADLPYLIEHALARIESESTRMSSLVGELLLLARLDEGHGLHLEEVDLSLILVDAVSDALAADPERIWVIDIPETSVLVNGDSERLHQVVANVLSNASLHTPPDTRITTALAVEDGLAVLTVTDDGPGIDPNVLPVLFERFARGDDSRSRRSGSTGLGLAIAHSIMEGHGGSISVCSTADGARFRIALPGRLDDTPVAIAETFAQNV